MISGRMFAQSPIIPLELWNGRSIPGSYVKDVNNLLDTFEGTYLYQNNGVLFKIVLEKKEMTYNQQFYEDVIIGEFEYEDVHNIVNTLSELTYDPAAPLAHHLFGHFIRGKNLYPKCEDCADDEKRLLLIFNDTHVGGRLLLRKVFAPDGSAALEAKRTLQYPMAGKPEDFPEPIVPGGTYLMIKQP